MEQQQQEQQQQQGQMPPEGQGPAPNVTMEGEAVTPSMVAEPGNAPLAHDPWQTEAGRRLRSPGTSEASSAFAGFQRAFPEWRPQPSPTNTPPRGNQPASPGPVKPLPPPADYDAAMNFIRAMTMSMGVGPSELFQQGWTHERIAHSLRLTEASQQAPARPEHAFGANPATLLEPTVQPSAPGEMQSRVQPATAVTAAAAADANGLRSSPLPPGSHVGSEAASTPAPAQENAAAPSHLFAPAPKAPHLPLEIRTSSIGVPGHWSHDSVQAYPGGKNVEAPALAADRADAEMNATSVNKTMHFDPRAKATAEMDHPEEFRAGGPYGIGAEQRAASVPKPSASILMMEEMRRFMAENVRVMQTIQERVKSPEGETTKATDWAEKVEEAARPDRRQRMVERKGFAKLPEFSVDAGSMDVWLFKFKRFMHQEPDYKPLLKWIEGHAMKEESEEKARPNTLLSSEMQQLLAEDGGTSETDDAGLAATATRIPVGLGGIPLAGGIVTNWADPKLEWLGDNLYEVLQSIVTGQHMTYLLRNLEPVTPSAARGCEALFRIIRDLKGNTGPRFMQLVKEIFNPTRISKIEQIGGALEAWGHHVQALELAGQPLSSVLKTFGLMQLLPAEMEGQLVLLRQQLTNYAKCRAWVLDQAAARTKVKVPEVNGLENTAEKEEAAGTADPEQPSQEELLAFWKKGGGKAKGKGKGIKGEC